jgi:cytochrome b pre-mRNA-processing protein 3
LAVSPIGGEAHHRPFLIRRRSRAKPMMFRWYRPTPRSSSITRLYGAIVAQARAPAFYQIYQVPDTVSARLEMIMLHVVLVLRHFREGDAAARNLGQRLFDEFCRDMDASMREMGVGDLAVPRKMRRIGEAFYVRQAAYGSALTEADNARLTRLLHRNVFAGAAQHDGAQRLAAYSREAVHLLANQERFDRGDVTFPDPNLASMRG